MSSPYDAPQAELAGAAPDPLQGHFGRGLLLGFATLVGGYALSMGTLVAVLLGHGHRRFDGGMLAGVLFASVLPWGALLALLLRYLFRSELRTVYGLVAAVAGLMVLGVLLLLAAVGVVAVRTALHR